MKRIDASALPDDLRDAHSKSMALRGDATFFEVFGNHPQLYRWYTERFYAELFRGGSVDRRLKELLRLRLSGEHGCRFCNQGNRVDALSAGLSEAEVDQIGRLDTWPPRERLVLELADQIALTNTDGRLGDDLHAALREHFNDAEILELGFVAGVLSGVAKFLFAYDLVEKEDSCPFA